MGTGKLNTGGGGGGGGEGMGGEPLEELTYHPCGASWVIEILPIALSWGNGDQRQAHGPLALETDFIKLGKRAFTLLQLII